MLTEAILSAIVKAVIGYALEQSGLGDTLRSALGRDSVKRAFARALNQAYAETSDKYRDAAARLFDPSFLEHEAVPVLAPILWRHGRPMGENLAGAWADSLNLKGPTRENGLREMTPVADFFLARLVEEAKKQGPLQELFDQRAREQTAEHTAVLPEILDILREWLPPEAAVGPSPPPARLHTRIPDPRADRLVGREEDLRWVCRRLKAGDTAAIASVRGIGGIGKTELAIAAAQELEAHFEGGVLWLDCGPNDAYAIQGRMAAALGVALEGDDLRIRADRLAGAFRLQPPTLVVLDDLRRRHMADLACITPPRPPCALLVTSRRYDLPLPEEAVRNLDVLSPARSRELLADLLPQAWLDAEAGVLGEIVRTTGRIPLALKLAARRAHRIAGRKDETADRPLENLLANLQAGRLQVLNQGEDPNRPDLSVVITFNASYGDLDPPDQTRLRRLGVFARNRFELPAMMAVWDDDEAHARQALERLFNAGLVEERARDTWEMHDLLREYAAERLAEAGPDEEQVARLAHAAHWQRYLDELDLRSVDDWHGLETHRPEVERAAGWLLADWQRVPELAAELAVAISQAFRPHAFARWEAWLTSGLAAAEAAGQRNAARRLQRGLAEYYSFRGEVIRARRLLQASLTTARELLQAAATEEEREAGQRGVAVTLGDIARLKAQGGDVAGALALHQEEMAVYEQLGDVRSRAVTLYDLANLHLMQEKYAEAERLYRESLEISRHIQDIEGTSASLVRLGELALGRGRRDEAVSLLQEARRGFEQLGFAPGSPRWMNCWPRLRAGRSPWMIWRLWSAPPAGATGRPASKRGRSAMVSPKRATPRWPL